MFPRDESGGAGRPPGSQDSQDPPEVWGDKRNYIEMAEKWNDLKVLDVNLRPLKALEECVNNIFTDS